MTANDPAAISINPFTGRTIATFPNQTDAEVEQTLSATAAAFRVWRQTPIADRAAIVRQMGLTLRTRSDEFAEDITREMGKTLAEARAEVQKCADQCEWYAANGPSMLADKAVSVEKGDAYISYLPLGPVLGVMPWNFPIWQVLRAAVPIILSGNCFVLKHSRNVMRSAFNIEDAWDQSGLPKGLFSILNIPQDKVAAVLADRRIAAVTVTAGTKAGSAVASQAGSLLKKSVLELGGSDAFIVLKDADVEQAVAAGIRARFQNNGQVCIAAKRFILEKPIAKEFTDRLVEGVRALRLGDPTESETQLGPMARVDLRTELHNQIESSKRAGAEILTGGGFTSDAGYFYRPTVLNHVAPGMAAFDQETFGPCAALTVVGDLDQAVALANHSQYGLSGNLWTKDLDLAGKAARRLETGGVFINGFSASDPRVPIGGVKMSGYGRELSYFGATEFVNIQTVWRNRS
ncbi:MAG: NAD-dependent succinate-semialdehyde dehydrogenase [Methylocella sp.]